MVTSINPAVAIDITGATNETFCSGDNVVFTVTNPPAMLPTIISYSMVLQPFKMVPLILPVDQHLNDGDTITAEVTLVSGCVVSAT